MSNQERRDARPASRIAVTMDSAWSELVRQVQAQSALELWAAVTGFVCVWLTVRENIWCWPVGIVSAVYYVVVFAQAKLYADMGLQVVFVVLQFYGWYEWLHGGADREALVVARTPPRMRLVLSGVFVVATVGLAQSLYRYTDASLPWVDSTQTVLSLIAQLLLSYKYVENWMLWIVVDVVSIWMYQYKGLYLTAVLYGVFLCLATVGLLRWQRVLRTQEGACSAE